ncbi:MAG: phosphate signaling complex protein PhoU [Deltaproteobacteria bacterium]|jgi:phosphate transport system protein|nr:phosphate signaling complex protein PhoU [Deltaproteobacteria bacterium]
MNTKETRLQQELERLRAKLLIMCASVDVALDNASAALYGGNPERVETVLRGDAAINTLEMEIDDMALSILARNQPVAHDLRFVVAALRMVLDLERIGDEAVSVAERALMLHARLPAAGMRIVNELMDAARALYARSVEVFRAGDAEKAMDLRRNEDEGSKKEMLALQRMVDYLRGRDGREPDWTPDAGLHALLACRALNRIRRRSVNIAEQTFFIARGENIKHIRSGTDGGKAPPLCYALGEGIPKA